nr:fibrinopeptide B [Oryctolagus cuniculus]
ADDYDDEVLPDAR